MSCQIVNMPKICFFLGTFTQGFIFFFFISVTVAELIYSCFNLTEDPTKISLKVDDNMQNFINLP